MIDERLSGILLQIEDKFSKLKLETSSEMIADSIGLIYGGFVFSLADYAAIIAINEPNVILGAANVRFIAPVKVGDSLIAQARVNNYQGIKFIIYVEVKRGEKIVFKEEFSCFILENHILDNREFNT